MSPWCEVMKEVNCKTTIHLSICDEREVACTHRHFGKDGKGKTSQLTYILGAKMASNQVYIHNHVKLWDTWGHYPIYIKVQEGDAQIFLNSREDKE